MLIFFGIACILIVFIFVGSYNSLVLGKNAVTHSFSSLDVILQKRYDLLPNLVELVKQYKDFESDTLVKMAQTRGQVLDSNLSNGDRIAFDNQLSSIMRGFMTYVQTYPNFETSDKFRELQRIWVETEEQIAAARRTYNASVIHYNNNVMVFPKNLFANLFGHSPMAVLETPAEERKNISAKALFNS